jgi:hypothetical protein
VRPVSGLKFNGHSKETPAPLTKITPKHRQVIITITAQLIRIFLFVFEFMFTCFKISLLSSKASKYDQEAI